MELNDAFNRKTAKRPQWIVPNSFLFKKVPKHNKTPHYSYNVSDVKHVVTLQFSFNYKGEKIF